MTARPPLRLGRVPESWIGPGDEEEEGSQVAARRVVIGIALVREDLEEWCSMYMARPWAPQRNWAICVNLLYERSWGTTNA